MNPVLRKSLIGIGIFAAIGAIATGIYLFYKRQIELALQYCYKISNVKIINFAKDNITLELFVKIQNKSDFMVEIKGYDFDVSLNNKDIAKITSDKSEMLKAQSISELSFMVTCNPAQIYDPDYVSTLIVYALTDKSKIVLSVNGIIHAKMNFVNIKKLKFDYTTNVKELLTPSTTEKVKCDIA
jgi:LEA14-like dessication related protein